MKYKFIFITCFFGILGLIGIFISVWTFITGEGFYGQNMITPNTENLFLKHDVGFLALFLSVPILAMAILPYKGLLTLDYHNAPRHIQAKNDLILQTLMLPVMFLFALMLNNGETEKNNMFSFLALIAGIMFAYRYIESIYILKKHNNDKRT